MPKNLAERLSALVQIPTVSTMVESTGVAPFERLIETLRLLYPQLHACLECERLTGTAILFHWKGTQPHLASQPLVLMAHADVAPVSNPDSWTHPPFGGVIEGGRVWGRGTLDNKGVLIVICEAIESLLAASFTPNRDIYICVGADEETNGSAAEVIAKTLGSRGLHPYLVLDEGGAVVEAPVPWVNARAAMVGVGEKGVMTVHLTTQDEPKHVSAPSSHTAISRIGRAVSQLTSSTFPARLPKSVTTALAAFVPHATRQGQVILGTLAKSPRLTAEVLIRLGGTAAALAHTTVAATMIQGGTDTNQLPVRASARVSVRIAIGETIESALKRINRRIGDPKVIVTMIDGVNPSPEAPTDTPQYMAIREAVEASYPGTVTVPYIMMSKAGSRHFHAFTDAVYRFAPLYMTVAQQSSVHGCNEYVDIDSLERGQFFYQNLIQTTSS